MTTAIEDLTTPLTVDQCRTAIYDALAARGVETTGWKPGAVVRTIIAGLAIVLAAFSQLQALIARSGFLELSEGAWLTLVARYVYGVERSTGSFATGIVTVDNASGGVYTGDADDLVFVSPTTGKAYRNTGTFTIGALATGVDIAVQAVELGSDSTAAPNTITELQTVLAGVTCTNDAALVGADAETDAELRQRCREKTGALSPNGPADAYSYFAKSAVRAADGSAIGVTRVKSVPDGFGTVDVYVATGSGAVTGTANDPSTDLGAVAAAIWEWAEPIAVTADVQTATALSIAVTYELWVRNNTGLTDAAFQTLIADALTDFMATQPIGGTEIPATAGKVYVSAIEGAIAAALPAGSLVRLNVTAPAADVTPTASQAPVLGTVTVTGIHQVAGSA